MKCKYLMVCDEAYRIDENGKRGAHVAAFVCTWARTHMPTVAPSWLEHRLGGGELILDVQRTCGSCQAFTAQKEDAK